MKFLYNFLKFRKDDSGHVCSKLHYNFLMRVFTEIYDSLKLCFVLTVQNARHLISYFSGKSLKLMPPDALILAQNARKCVWRPGPAGGAHSTSPDPSSWIQGVIILRGREEKIRPILYPNLGE